MQDNIIGEKEEDKSLIATGGFFFWLGIICLFGAVWFESSSEKLIWTCVLSFMIVIFIIVVDSLQDEKTT